MNSLSPWIVRPDLPGDDAVRLFCLPYAGGSASSYARWQRRIGPGVAVCPVELPGRGRRVDEPPIADFFDLVVRTAEGLSPHLGSRFALFGHSMGALLAFEVARYLQRERGREPTRFFASACRAPRAPARLSPMSGLPSERLMRELEHRYGGIPGDILDDPEMWESMLPVLRADLVAIEGYDYVATPRALSCPVHAFGGTDDRTVDTTELETWSRETGGSFTWSRLEGGHFFVHTAWAALADAVGDALDAPVRRG